VKICPPAADLVYICPLRQSEAVVVSALQLLSWASYRLCHAQHHCDLWLTNLSPYRRRPVQNFIPCRAIWDASTYFRSFSKFLQWNSSFNFLLVGCGSLCYRCNLGHSVIHLMLFVRVSLMCNTCDRCRCCQYNKWNFHVSDITEETKSSRVVVRKSLSRTRRVCRPAQRRPWCWAWEQQVWESCLWSSNGWPGDCRNWSNALFPVTSIILWNFVLPHPFLILVI